MNNLFKFRINHFKIIALILLMLGSLDLSAQSNVNVNGYTWVILGVVLLLVVLLLVVGDNLLQVEAKNIGADAKNTNFSIFPRWNEIFRPKVSKQASSEKIIALSRGHDIKLEGAAKQIFLENSVRTFSVKPTDFIGMAPIPKVEVEAGQQVKAGDILFFDKRKPEIKYCSPVSGEVIEVRRGAKRSIAEVIISADTEMSYRELNPPSLTSASREELMTFLADAGFLPHIIQRPFQVVPSLDANPKNVFISTFDSAPLAPDNNFVIKGNETSFQKGLEVLTKLTEGKVHLGLNAKAINSTAFTEATGVEKHWFVGKHPAGNVGVQIHHVAPINAGEHVWTLNVQSVITLGNMFLENKYDASRVVAVVGAEVENPAYTKTYIGANVNQLVANNLSEVDGNLRFVSGDVLSGRATEDNGFMSFHDDQLTVLLEGDQYELFGWLLPITPRPSVSNTFPGFIMPNFKYRANTNTHGEKRAFVMTGQYEKVLPMDVYPQHLMKAIITNDFEKMEGLGIYELAEEDVALCEFVCTSKQPLQKILREGLNELREQV